MAIPGYDLYRDRIPNLLRTNAGLGGDIPQQTIKGYTPRFDKRFYKSLREQAIITDKTLRGGYGVLETGMIMAVDQNDTDLLVPYTPDTIDQLDVSRVFMLNGCDAADNFNVEMYESYKLAEGDAIVLTDTNGVYEEAEIDSIDRTSSVSVATVTLAAACAGTFTTARSACCYVKAGDGAADTKNSVAAYILEQTVDTGAGADARGALGSVLLTNALVYADAFVGLDDQAVTDLGNLVAEGVYYVIR